MRAFATVLLALLIAAAWWFLRGAAPAPPLAAPTGAASTSAAPARSGEPHQREGANGSGGPAPSSADPAAALASVGAPGAVVVRGEVVDDLGAVVEGVTVSIADIDTSRPSAAVVLQADTDVRGRFAIEGAGPGDWYVSVGGLGQLDSRTTKIPAGVAEHFVRITVERPDPETMITGIVVDEDGGPIAGAGVSGYGEGFYGLTRSRADGTFAVPRASPRHNDGTPGVRLTAGVAGLDQVVPAPGERVRWGQGDVRVVLRRMPGAWLQVLAPDGQPAAGYDAFVWHVGYRTAAVLRPLVCVRDSADGRARLENLRLGRHQLLIRAVPERTWSMIGLERFEVGASPEVPDVVVRAASPAPLIVQGVDFAGRAVTGFRAELIFELAGQPCNLRCLAPALADLDEAAARRALWLTVAQSESDAEGRVELQAPPGHYWLRVRGEAVLPRLAQVELTTGGTVLPLQLRAGGAIAGRLWPAAAVARLWPPGAADSHSPTVRVDCPDGGEPPPPTTVAADGAFTLTAVPPGRCELILDYYLDTGEVARPVSVGLGECVVTVDRRQQLEFDVRALLPGTLRLAVTLDGLPLPDAQMFLRQVGEGPLVNRRAQADGDGRYEALLPPGTWSVLLALQAVPGPGYNMLPLPQRFAIRANAVTEMTAAARTRTLRVRLVDEAGAPLAGMSVRVDRTGGYFRPGGLETDETGWFELMPAPYGQFHLLVRGGAATGAGDETKVGPLELPDERASGNVEVTVRR